MSKKRHVYKPELTTADETEKMLYLQHCTVDGEPTDSYMTFDLSKARAEASRLYYIEYEGNKRNRDIKMWIEGFIIPTDGEILDPDELFTKDLDGDDITLGDPDYYEDWNPDYTDYELDGIGYSIADCIKLRSIKPEAVTDDYIIERYGRHDRNPLSEDDIKRIRERIDYWLED